MDQLHLEQDRDLDHKKLINIACGTDTFLVSAAAKLVKVERKNGLRDDSILELILTVIYGLDLNPVACAITKINLFLILLNKLPLDTLIHHGPLDFNVYCTNAIENRSPTENETSLATKLKHRHPPFEAGFD